MPAGELIPIDGLIKMDMSLVPNGASRMGASGQSIVSRNGPTRWRLQVQTDYLDLLEARIWSTWISRRIHLGETFTAWKLFRGNPLFGIGGSPDGSLGLSVDAANNRISISGSSGYNAGVGDTISYRTLAGGFCLVEVQASQVGSSNISVVPRPMAAHAVPQVRRVQALAEFELSTPLDPFEDYTGRSLSFEAMQVLR